MGPNNWTTSYGVTVEHFTKPVEGQNDGQDTAAFNLRVALEASDGSRTTGRLSSEH